MLMCICIKIHHAFFFRTSGSDRTEHYVNIHKLKDCFVKVTQLPISVGQSVKVLGVLTNNSGTRTFNKLSSNSPNSASAPVVSSTNSKAILDLNTKRLNAKIISISSKRLKALTKEGNINAHSSKSVVGKVRVVKPSALFNNLNQSDNDVVYVIDDDDTSINDWASTSATETLHECPDNRKDLTIRQEPHSEKTTENILEPTEKCQKIISSQNGMFNCNICFDSFPNETACIAHAKFHVDTNTSTPLSFVKHNWWCGICNKYYHSELDWKNHTPCNNEIQRTSTAAEEVPPRIHSPLFIDVGREVTIEQDVPCVNTSPSESANAEIETVDLCDDDDDELPLEASGAVKSVLKVLQLKNKTGEKKKEYMCVYCNVEFKRAPSIENHHRFAHPNIKPLWYCLWCLKICVNVQDHKHKDESTTTGKQFSVTRLKRKQKYHIANNVEQTTNQGNVSFKNVEMTYKCFYCSKEFISAVIIQQHMILDHDGSMPKYYCYKCNKMFPSLKDHIHVPYETQQSPHTQRETCKVCGEVITNETERSRHENLYHSKLKTYSKKEAPQKTASKTTSETLIVPGALYSDIDSENLEETPYTSDKTYKCLYCEDVFDTHKEISEHVHLRHSRSEQESYNCMKCGKYFPLWENHTHNPSSRICSKTGECHDYQLKPHEKKSSIGKDSVYQCTYCYKSYFSIDEIMIHVQYHHPRVKEPTYNCLKCCKTYMSLLNHTHDININCLICGQIFLNRTERDKHESELHNPPDSMDKSPKHVYACLYCPERFIFFPSVQMHLQTKHRDLTSAFYRCIKCVKNYSSSSRHSHQANLRCKLCGVVFQTRILRDRHVRENHQHEQFHQHRYSCISCSRYYGNCNSVIRHILNNHKNNDEAKYRCIKCKANYKITDKHGHLDDGLDEEPITNASGASEKTTPLQNALVSPLSRKRSSTGVHNMAETVELNLEEDVVEVKEEPKSSTSSEVVIHGSATNENELFPTSIRKIQLFKHTIRTKLHELEKKTSPSNPGKVDPPVVVAVEDVTKIRSFKKEAYKCHMCAKAFLQLPDLQGHMRRLHGQKKAV